MQVGGRQVRQEQGVGAVVAVSSHPEEQLVHRILFSRFERLRRSQVIRLERPADAAVEDLLPEDEGIGLGQLE